MNFKMSRTLFKNTNTLFTVLVLRDMLVEKHLFHGKENFNEFM